MSRFTELAQDVHTALNDPSVQAVIGNDNQKRRGGRRRIHWYRRGGPIVTHSRASGTQVGNNSGNRITTSWERQGLIECHLFAENDDTIELVCDNLIAAISNTLPPGGFEFDDYDWDDDQVNQRGPYIVLRFMVKYPVNDEVSPLTPIVAEEHDCMIEEL